MKEREIFDKALAITAPAERSKFLDEVCGDNERLRGHLEGLLLAHKELGSFLQSPPVEAVSPTIEQPITEQPGTVIGPYKLLQQIGEGGMGIVYLAEQSEPVERRVALKIIKPGMDTRQVIARFEAEEKALAMMDHPNIAKVLDAGTTDSGRPYFVMELVKGIPITKYCDQQHLTPKERLELFTPICQAVQHAHQKGIIHRDIKPTNILVALYDGKPVPKVIDFGVAKATSQKLTEKTMFTECGQLVGTLEYMSPEQANLNQLDIDTRSDIYSLGVLLYELLTGATPFDRERLRSVAFEEMLRIIREEEPQRPSLRLSTIDTLPSVAANRHVEPKKLSTLVRGELDWIVMKALEKDRARRYETATGLANDIQRYLNDDAVAACPPSRVYRFRKFAKRNIMTLATVSLVATALVLGLLGTTWQMMRAREAEELALTRYEEAEAAHQSEATQRALAEQRQAESEAQRMRADSEARRALQAAEQAEEEAEKARVALAFAKAVNEFLHKDLLSQASPSLEPDRDIKLRTVVDRAAAKIADRFANQPLVEAAIRQTLGQTYLSLGEYEEAERQTQRALEIRRRSKGEEDASTLESMTDLACIYHREGRYEEAEPLVRKTLEIRQRVMGEDHLATTVSLNNLAMLYQEQGRSADALALLLKSLELTQQICGEEHFETLTSMNNLAYFYLHHGRYADAQPLLTKALEIAQRELGEEHPETLGIMNNLAALYRFRAQYERAEPLLNRVLQIEKQVLGEHHHDTLLTTVNLSALYKAQGRRADAESLLQTTVDTLRSVLGVDHPDTRSAMGSLAELYTAGGRYPEAESLGKQVLESCCRRLGETHPTSLIAMRCLAGLYRAQGRYEKAETLLTQVIDTQRSVLGESHPDTLDSLNHLGVLYDLQGRYDEAEPLMCKVLEVRRETLGDKHPATLNAMANVSMVHFRRGRWKQAELLGKQALDAHCDVLGDEHPKTLMCMNNLALIFQAQGRNADAERLLRKTLGIYRRQLGEEHRDTLMSMHNLASVCQNQGNHGEAESLLVMSTKIMRRVLRESDPLLLSSLNNLAGLYRTLGRFPEAESLYVDSLKIMRIALGEEHPVTLQTASNLGVLYWNQGRDADAEPLFQTVFDIFRRQQGEKHPDTLMSMHNLASLYQDQGRYADAEQLFLKTLELRRSVLGENHRATLSTMCSLAGLYRIQNRLDEAESMLGTLVTLRRRQAGKLDPFAGWLVELGLCLITDGKHAEAEPLLREALTIREQKMSDDWRRFAAMSLLGASLLGQAQSLRATDAAAADKLFAEAEPLLVQGYVGWKQRQAAMPARQQGKLATSLQRVVELYDAWGKPQQASEWRQKVE